MQQYPTPVSDTWSDEGGILALIRVLNACLRRWRLFVVMPFLLSAATVLYISVQPDTYTSRAAVMPQGRQLSGGMSGLAERFGLNLGSGGESESPQLYAMLLRSDGLLRQLGRRRYTTGAEMGDGVLLADYFGIEEESEPLKEAALLEALRNRISVSTNDDTGVVAFTVTTQWPALSAALAKDLIDLLHEFNLSKRQTRGRAEREFTSTRLEEARADFMEAQDALAQFLRQNRHFVGSPELEAEHRRLASELEFRSAIHNSLAQALEQAKIEEVRTTPVLTVVDPPFTPALEDPSHLVSSALLALLLGLLLAGAWALTAEHLNGLHGPAAQAARDFRRLLTDMLLDLRRGPRGWWSRAP